MASVAAAARAVRLLVPRRARASDQGVRSARPGRLPADRRRPSDRPRGELPTSWGKLRPSAGPDPRLARVATERAARAAGVVKGRDVSSKRRRAPRSSGVRRVLHRVRSAGIRAQAARGCHAARPAPEPRSIARPVTGFGSLVRYGPWAVLGRRNATAPEGATRQGPAARPACGAYPGARTGRPTGSGRRVPRETPGRERRTGLRRRRVLDPGLNQQGGWPTWLLRPRPTIS